MVLQVALLGSNKNVAHGCKKMYPTLCRKEEELENLTFEGILRLPVFPTNLFPSLGGQNNQMGEDAASLPLRL